MHTFNVRDDRHVEEVDGSLLVVDPTSSTAFLLTDEQAEAFRLAQAGATVVPDHLVAAMAGLVELGLVEAPGWDRRRVLLAGGALASAAVVALALPSAAAAQSAPGSGDGDPGSGTIPPPTEPPAAPTIESIQFAGVYQGFRAGYFVTASAPAASAQVTGWEVSVNEGPAEPTYGRLPGDNGPFRQVLTNQRGTLRIRALNVAGASPYSAAVAIPYPF